VGLSYLNIVIKSDNLKHDKKRPFISLYCYEAVSLVQLCPLIQ
jgi:hypothetical protein